MLYELINERLIREFPNYIEFDGKIYTNELAKDLVRGKGTWFELIVKPQPQYNPETQFLTRRFYIEGDYIYQDWDITEVSLNEDAII